MTQIEYLRQFKINGYAVFDFAASFLLIYLLAPILTKIFSFINLKIPKKSWMFLTIPFSIITHIAVGNITPMTENFLNPNDYFLLKAIILLLVILGISPIKKIKK